VTPHLFISAGEALFGSAWEKPLAESLKVRDDTVRHWRNGRNPIPPGIAAELSGMLADVARQASAVNASIVRECGPFVDDRS